MPPQQRFDRRDIRRFNAVSVLRQLRIGGAMTRARIAENLGLTRATVSNIVSDLLESSLVTETRFQETGAGRPGVMLELNPRCGCIIAVEIDLDRISVVMADASQHIHWREDVAFPLRMDSEECLEKAEALIRHGLDSGREQALPCLGIGVAWAGLVDHELGELAYGPISGWEHVRLKERWESLFKLPLYVENEAHAGALGAFHALKAEGAQNLIYLSVGVGLAAGIIVGGQLLRGSRGFAGQVGHTAFASNNITCGCGKTGCWVTEIGASAVVRKLQQAGVRTNTEGPESDWVECVESFAQNGHPDVLQILNGVGHQIGEGLAAMVEAFDPSLVVVGGRLGKLIHFSQSAIQESLTANTLPFLAESATVRISRSDEDQLAGCIATVYDAILANPDLVKREQMNP